MDWKFWEDWDDSRKASAIRILGVISGVLCIFMLISIVSYLFNWKPDMSALGDPSAPVANKAGRSGAGFGQFLVNDCFGLGSFAFVVVLAAIAARLVVHKWHPSMLKTVILSVAAAFVSSFALACIGHVTKLETLFGGGLGGSCGAYLVSLSRDLVGDIVTYLLAVTFILILLFFCSDRFNGWFAGLGAGSEDKDKGKSCKVAVADEKANPAETADVKEIPEDTAVEEILTEDADPATVSSFKSNVETVAPVPEAAQPAQPAGNANDVQESPASAAGGVERIDDDTLEAKVRQPLKRIDNRLDPPDGLPRYRFPGLELLGDYTVGRHEVSDEEINRNNNKIRATLANYKVSIDDVQAVVGPTVTLYKVYLSAGVRISEIKKLQEDIAMSLNAKGVRVVSLTDSVGIEVANDTPSIVPLKSLLNDKSFRESKAELPVAIGYTITQKVKVFDLADAPHLLIAGATKQGKSVGLNVIVSSLLYSKHPSELKFVFIDPKMVEFQSYSGLLHHYLAVLPDAVSEKEEKDNAIVKNPKNAEKALRSCCVEMDERYELISKAGVNNIKLYNDKYRDHHLRSDEGHRFLPYLVVVVDEYADLTMTIGGSPEARAASKSITNSIIRLAQKGRAAGLHVILATQRPSVDVISGIIKSNFPMRIAFRVASRVDSNTIIDAPGAEKLIGKGDMLFSAGIDSERIQCGFISGDEIDAITGFIQDQSGYGRSYNTPYYLPAPTDPNAEGGSDGMTDMKDLDERFEEAAKLVVTTQKASTSYLQTRLGMGFAKAARVMSQLESAGIVGPQEGSKPRQIMIPDLESLEPVLKAFRK